MKKAIVLLLALVAFGAFAFATDAPLGSYTLAANAGAQWQYDLNNSKSGFTNNWDLSFKYMLMNGVSATKGGEGTYGQIDVTRVNLRIVEEVEGATNADGVAAWTDKNPDDGIQITAKIVSGDLTIGLGYGAFTGSYNNAGYVPLFAKDKGYDPGSAIVAKVEPAGSIKIAYKLGDMGSVSAVVGSKTAGATNTFSQYDVGFDASLTPVKDVLALDAGVWYDMDASKAIFTVKAKVTSGDLSATVAMDGMNTTSLVWDAAANVAYSLFEKKDSINLDVYYTDQLSPAPAAGKFPALDTSHKADVGFKFVDAEGLVPGLAFTLGVFADDLGGSSADKLLSVAGSGSYKVVLSDTTNVKPYGNVKVDMSGAKKNWIKVGLEANLITNVLLDANFVMGAESKDVNHVLAAAADPQVITISAKVTL